MGIDVDRTISLTFMLGGLLAGAAGMIYALYNGTIQFNQGFTAGLIAFTAAVMGGIGNLKGAVVGGLIIGVIQSISDTHYGQVWTPAVVFAILILVMVFRPPGPVRRGDEGRMTRVLGRRAASGARDAPRAVRAPRPLPTWAWGLIFIAPRDPLPVHPRPADGVAGRPARRLDPDARLHDHGPRPEHRRRVRRASSTSATSRSTRSAPSSSAGSGRSSSPTSPAGRGSTSSRRAKSAFGQRRARHPHQLLHRHLHRRGVHRRSGA